ncbi:MAG: uridine kinase family protein [Anaerolineae bacterium]
MINAIETLLSQREAPVVVALDGGSGAGKSTLAAAIAAAFDTALIPLDDFFAAGIPDARWDTFTTEEKLARAFDWDRVRREALEPLLEGRPARWHAFDFAAGLRPDGTYGMEETAKERAPADVILLEGAYAAGPALADLVDLTILVDVPLAVRYARLEDREDPDFLAAWHARWDDVEAHYFTHVRPPRTFDLVVKGQAGAPATSTRHRDVTTAKEPTDEQRQTG